MRVGLAEVAPVAAPAIEALPWLLSLALLLYALGAIKAVIALIDFVIWMIRKTVGHIPFAGGAIEGLAKKGAQKLTNALGQAEQSVDHYIGLCFHNLAIIVRMFAREIEGLAHDLWMISGVIPGLVTQIVLHHFVSTLLHPIRAAQHLIHRLVHIARTEVIALRHMVVQGVYPRIHAGEATIEHVLEPEIARLRERTKALEAEYARLYRWSRAHARTIATAAFIGATAIALRKLGGGWIRCRNWRRIGKHVCGLPLGLIEDILGLGLAFLVVVDPVDIAKAAIKTEDLMHAFVVKIAEAND